MLKGKHLSIILLAIIGFFCIIKGLLVLYPHQDIAAAPAVSNLQKSDVSDHPPGRTDYPEGYSSPWIPTTDIVLIESHFRQDEPGIRVLVGWVKNTGQETVTDFPMNFNLSDPTETEYHEIGYSVGSIRFLPNQTRDFEAIITNHDTMTQIKNATITVLK